MRLPTSSQLTNMAALRMLPDTRCVSNDNSRPQVLSWRQKPLEELPDSLQRLVEMRSPHVAECKLCQHVIEHRVASADS